MSHLVNVKTKLKSRSVLVKKKLGKILGEKTPDTICDSVSFSNSINGTCTLKFHARAKELNHQ